MGEIISRNGKNGENIKERIGKVKAAVAKALTCAQSRIMQRIGTKVSIMLHQTAILPTLLYGSETWILDAKESILIERIDLWAIKKIFGLPPTTPTPAVRYFTGTMFTDILIKKKQLVYLQHLLQKYNGYWPKEALATQKEEEFGWWKNIQKTLEQWGLEQQWDVIAYIYAQILIRQIFKNRCKKLKKGIVGNSDDFCLF